MCVNSGSSIVENSWYVVFTVLLSGWMIYVSWSGVSYGDMVLYMCNIVSPIWEFVGKSWSTM